MAVSKDELLAEIDEILATNGVIDIDGIARQIVQVLDEYIDARDFQWSVQLRHVRSLMEALHEHCYFLERELQLSDDEDDGG